MAEQIKMATQTEKRTRTKNFSEKEKEMLIALINPHKHIIENIKTDSVNVRKKNQTWEEIAFQFNCHVESGTRTVQQLKTVYDMAKRKAKKSLNDDKVSMYKITKLISPEEQSMIVDLVNSHYSALFTGQQYEKDEAWSNVLDTYNLHQSTGIRTLEDLQYIFENLNKSAKIENRTDKIERYKTGGGTFQKSLTSISEQVLGVISERTEPLINLFDDDNSYTSLPSSINQKGKKRVLDFDANGEADTFYLDNNMLCEEIDITFEDLNNSTVKTNHQDQAINSQSTISNKNTDTTPYSSKSIKTTVLEIPNQVKPIQYRSSPKTICENLQELTKKKLNKVQANEEFSSELHDLKVKRAKLDLHASEITVEILKTDLAMKKMEMDSKVKQMQLQEDILILQKQKLNNSQI